MEIVVLSDIHDNLWNLGAALDHVAKADVLICCGDLCSPFVIDQLSRFPGQVHIVFGNNDADLFRITRKSSDHVQVHGEYFETEIDGRKIAVNHFDYIARPIIRSGLYDIVCFGHNHEFSVSRAGRTLAINPGAIMGARFPSGHWEDVAPTFVVVETRTIEVQGFEIAASPGGGRREVRPHEFQEAADLFR